ncbi:secretory pathway protein Sec39-domain-containing protein [Collybia nuda]|uniref:Secretory pathway protein Sec39-domain-containing protein n=1 Tax=Collybia nuda TaxID=64659 RepID=A0A9P5Y3Q2_9AGAR|nr:secretory pathway protein Sec39-domain-containing protein [Collybia nuda]
MRPLTEDESKMVFTKLANYIGKNLVHLIDRPDEPYCFRLQKDRVYYVSEASMRLGISVARPNLVSLGTCFGKFSKSGKFKLHITALDYVAQYAKYKVWIKPNGEMPFLYGNHVVKAHLGRITEDTPEHQGVVVFNMKDIPLGFGVTARSTVDTRKLDPTSIIVFHQADVGEYLRDEVVSHHISNDFGRFQWTHVYCTHPPGFEVLSREINDLLSAQRLSFGSLSAIGMVSNPYTSWAALANEDLTVDVVEKLLSSIQDDLWVATACLDRVLDDAEVQQRLLHVGLARTSAAVERGKDVVAFVADHTDASHCHEHQAREISKAEDSFHDTLTAHLRGMPADAQLCSIRTILLERLDRLNTHVEICKVVPHIQKSEEDNEVEEWEDDPWAEGESESYSSKTTNDTNSTMPLPITLSSFLSEKLLSSACLLASLQWFDALRIMFRRHSSLSSSRLIIISNIPEHVHPLNYGGILDIFPNLDSPTTSNHWRSERDWSESPEVQAALTSIISTYTPFPGNPQPFTADELSVWYQNRVDAVILATGFVDTALVTIQHGASQGIPGLDELGEELSLLSRLIYDAPQGLNIVDWTLDRWRTMDPATVMRAYLIHSTPESLSKDISRLVMPYLYVLEARAERTGNPDTQLPIRLLYDYVLSAPLEMAAAIFEASKPTLPVTQRLIRDDEDIARLALACLYGSDSIDQWSNMSRIFECLPAWNISQDEDEDDVDVANTTAVSLGAFVTPSTLKPRCTPTDIFIFFKPLPIASLSRALDILDVHLESGEILSRWSVPAPLRWFLQSNTDMAEQRSWANRMARRAGGLEDQLNSAEDWEWLLEDMLKLSGTGDSGFKGAFGLLKSEEIMRIFFSGLLSSGKFDIARNLLHSPGGKLALNSLEVEEICLSSSREFYDNASSGNYTFGDMKLAYDCLNVPETSERLLREKDFIEATSRISSFNVTSKPGIPISPIEIRLTKDRLSLVSRVLSSNNDAYKHTEVILDLVQKLGFLNDVVAEVKTLAMLADTALQVEDFHRAYELSERMSEAAIKFRSFNPLGADEQVTEVNEVCWVACFQLGRQSEFDDLNKKLLLLGRALELCPAEKLPDVLGAWRRLEKEDIKVREEKLGLHSSATTTFGPPKHPRTIPSNVASSLRTRLQNFHIPSPPLLSTPDAAALASRTFRSVAANFPFSVVHSQPSEADTRTFHSGDMGRPDGEDVSTQATRVFSKGIGWLIGADEGM